MKILKWIVLMVAIMTTITARVWATEPPASDSIRLHLRDGRVTPVAFASFKHLKFSNNNMLLVRETESESTSVSMDDLSKITFFQKQPQPIAVTFSAVSVGTGSGTLSAYVWENGVQTQTLTAGDDVQAGKTVKFKAEPNAESKVKGWRINGVYQASGAKDKTVVLNETQHKDGLSVEVEFEAVTMVAVTFATTGSGSGTLSAYVWENGAQTQTLTSGDKVQAGNTVLFKATPNAESKVKGWRINDTYQASAETEKMVVLNETQQEEGLSVEVEFEKPTGIEDLEAERSTLNVYVKNRAINIESTVGIECVGIWNISGRLLESRNYGNRHSVSISAGKLNAGLYFLKIRTAEKEETRKVIIR